MRTRGVLAAVLLGVGFCLKLYPGLFVLPLALYVLTRNRARDDLDVRGAAAVVGAAAATVAAINLPFAVHDYTGWRASFSFQQLREADLTSNSIWYWGLRPLMGAGDRGSASYHALVGTLSPLALAAGFASRCGWAGAGTDARGVYPWIGVSASMLCAFVLLHKVHSPQYTLWLLPFLVLLGSPGRWSARTWSPTPCSESRCSAGSTPSRRTRTRRSHGSSSSWGVESGRTAGGVLRAVHAGTVAPLRGRDPGATTRPTSSGNVRSPRRRRARGEPRLRAPPASL